MSTDTKNAAFKSKWVWAAFGLMALVFFVNYLFFSAAIGTSPGLVNEEYYKYGLQQNKIDRQFRTQSVRGWQVHLNIDHPWKAGESNVISVNVLDKDNKPLSGGLAEVTAYRPSDAKADIVLHLKESSDGVYQSALTLPMKGVWDLNVLFTLGEDKHMLNQRVSIAGDSDDEPSTLEKIVNFIVPQ